jgi:hypothetical protein
MGVLSFSVNLVTPRPPPAEEGPGVGLAVARTAVPPEHPGVGLEEAAAVLQRLVVGHGHA